MLVTGGLLVLELAYAAFVLAGLLSSESEHEGWEIGVWNVHMYFLVYFLLLLPKQIEQLLNLVVKRMFLGDGVGLLHFECVCVWMVSESVGLVFVDGGYGLFLFWVCLIAFVGASGVGEWLVFGYVFGLGGVWFGFGGSDGFAHEYEYNRF